jgi:hypothetical protein
LSSVREIVPGVFHWTAFHPRIRAQVSSYYLSEGGVLIDPLLPEEGFEGGQDPIAWLRQNGPPMAILLSNRHHYRHSGRLVEALGIPVYASEPGMHEFKAGQAVEPFRFGDSLPGGVIAHEVGVICPDETALEAPSVRALALADGLVRFQGLEAPLGFVPDWLVGDDPEAVKSGLTAAFARLLELDFDHLLLAHGAPIVGEGKEELRAFVEG